MKTALALLAATLIQQPTRPTFVARVDAVRADVLVTNRGSPIAGLTAADFELRDNGVLQRIGSVERQDVPLDVLLVLDISGSVAGAPLDRLREAAHTLLGELGEQDRAALVTFSERLRAPVWPPATAREVGKAIDAIGVSGATALLDAVYAALVLRQRSSNRVMVLVFSDGFDTTSWMPEAAILETAKQTDAVVYTVAAVPREVQTALPFRSLPGPSGQRLDAAIAGSHAVASAPSEEIPAFLEELAVLTGGRLFVAQGRGARNSLRNVFVRALRDMKSRYVLSYTPQGVAREGWHAIDVTLTRRKGKVTARRGYLVGTGG